MIHLEENYKEAFSEVYAVFQIMPKKLKEKVSKDFYLMIEKERNPYYTIDIVTPLENNSFKDETIVLLGIIYRDFLCSKEEKRIMKMHDEEEIKKIEFNKCNNIKINELFNTHNKKSIENNSLLVVEKEKIYIKILKVLKGIILKKQ